MTIEHIGSQNPANKGSLSAKCVGMIGNLMLVDTKLNAKLGNKDFAAKKKVLLGSRVWLDDGLKKATLWSDAEVQQRSQSLAALAYNSVWAL